MYQQLERYNTAMERFGDFRLQTGLVWLRVASSYNAFTIATFIPRCMSDDDGPMSSPSLVQLGPCTPENRPQKVSLLKYWTTKMS